MNWYKNGLKPTFNILHHHRHYTSYFPPFHICNTVGLGKLLNWGVWIESPNAAGMHYLDASFVTWC